MYVAIKILFSFALFFKKTFYTEISIKGLLHQIIAYFHDIGTYLHISNVQSKILNRMCPDEFETVKPLK